MGSLEINETSILAVMEPGAQLEAARAMTTNAKGRLGLIEAEASVAQLVDASRREPVRFVRNGSKTELNYFRRTVTALGRGLRYGNPVLRVGAAIVAGEVHDALFYAHDAPRRLYNLPPDPDMGDRLDVLHTALRITDPDKATVQEQLVRAYILPGSEPSVQLATAAAITGLTRTLG